MSSSFITGVAAAVVVTVAAGKANKPNILFILGDDLGYVRHLCALTSSS
jgi:hypothetical protein